MGRTLRTVSAYLCEQPLSLHFSWLIRFYILYICILSVASYFLSQMTLHLHIQCVLFHMSSLSIELEIELWCCVCLCVHGRECFLESGGLLWTLFYWGPLGLKKDQGLSSLCFLTDMPWVLRAKEETGRNDEYNTIYPLRELMDSRIWNR